MTSPWDRIHWQGMSNWLGGAGKDFFSCKAVPHYQCFHCKVSCQLDIPVVNEVAKGTKKENYKSLQGCDGPFV